MSVRIKKYFVVIAAWFLSLLVISAFPIDIPTTTGIAFLLFLFIGLILLVFFLVVLIRRRTRYEPAIAIILVVIICIVVFNRGHTIGARIHLLVNKSRYEAVLAKLSSAQSDEERVRICGDDCIVLTDEPLRVAFHYAHWFLNWKDIVYDPTGAISGNDFRELKSINVYLFGGERLTGEWYLGHFGD